MAHSLCVCFCGDYILHKLSRVVFIFYPFFRGVALRIVTCPSPSQREPGVQRIIYNTLPHQCLPLMRKVSKPKALTDGEIRQLLLNADMAVFGDKRKPARTSVFLRADNKTGTDFKRAHFDYSIISDGK